MSSFERVIARDGKAQPSAPQPPELLEAWLEDLIEQRRVTIMRLRQLDRVLLKYGKIKSEYRG